MSNLLPFRESEGPRRAWAILASVALVGIVLVGTSSASAVVAPPSARSPGASASLALSSPVSSFPSDPAGPSGPSGALPAAPTYPWSGGVVDNGTNSTGVSLFLGNITIPAADPDLAGYNYTVGIAAADSDCELGEAGLADSTGIWKFHWLFESLAGGVAAPVQGWDGHLAPGDTYQLVLNLTGSEFEAQLFNVSAGHFWQGSSLPPDLVASMPSSSLSFLVSSASLCAGQPTGLTVEMEVAASGAASGLPSRDYFVQDEAVVVGRAPPTSEVPNLWQAFFKGAPAGFAPQQSWSTTSLVSVATDHPVITETATTLPEANVDIGQAVSVGVVGVPRLVPGAANMNTEELTRVEFAGPSGSGSLGFATCSSKNGSTSNPGYPGSDPGVSAEYGYSLNTTPTLSTIYVAYAGGTGPALATNMSLDLRCFTGPLTTPGWLDVYGLSYLQYDLPGGTPLYPIVDSLFSGPRDFLGLNALYWNVTVHALPTLGISVAPSSTVTVGEAAHLTAVESGGSPSLTYTWYLNGTAYPACTTTTCALSWSGTGHPVVWVAVVDGQGNRAVSPHENLTVVPDVSASLLPSPTAVGSVGSPIVFTAGALGGTGGYTYNFSLNGSAHFLQSGGSGSLSYTPAHGGVYQLWAEVNDSNHDSAASAHTNLTVAEGLVAAVAPSAATTEPGLPPVVLRALAGGGAAPYTYAWMTGTLTTQGPCDLECNVSSATPGVYQAWVVVTDSAGRVGTSAHTNLTVLPNPAFTRWTGPTVVDAGANTTLSAAFSGGDLPLTYSWALNGSAVLYCRSSSCGVVVPHAGPATLTVAVLDALGVPASATPLTLSAVLPPSVDLTPIGPVATEVGLSVALSATPRGGIGGFSFGFLTSWAPLGAVGVGPSGAYSWSPSLAGSGQVWAEVNDSTGDRAVSAHTNVSVVATLGVSIEPTPTASTYIGRPVNATAALTGGATPVAYTWFDSGTEVSGCSSDACSFTWVAVGTYQVWAVGVDLLGVRAASSHTNVTVASTVHSVPPVVYLVHLTTSPSGEGGGMTVGGTSYVPGASAAETAGTYLLTFLNPTGTSGYSFQSWQTSGGVSVGSASSSNTTLEVTGNGTLTAVLSGPSGGIFGLGLSTDTLEILAVLGAVLLVLVIIGVARHRSNQRNTHVVPPPRAGYAGSTEGGSGGPPDEGPPAE